MITKIEMGDKHKDVSHVQFGTGAIRMTKVEMDDKSFGLALSINKERKKIGETDEEYRGVPIEEWHDEIKVLMTFSNPHSVNAVIHSLVELQEAIFNGMLK